MRTSRTSDRAGDPPQTRPPSSGTTHRSAQTRPGQEESSAPASTSRGARPRTHNLSDRQPRSSSDESLSPTQRWLPHPDVHRESRNSAPRGRPPAHRDSVASTQSRRVPTVAELADTRQLARLRELVEVRGKAKCAFTRIANRLQTLYLDPTAERTTVLAQLAKMEAAHERVE